MAIERRITITTAPPGSSPRITFAPNPLQANAMDQIFWTNDDSQPHWPGRKNDDGSVNPTFFMPNQIASGGDVSPIFSSTVSGTLNYVCTLAGHQNETGSIVISGRGHARADGRSRPPGRSVTPEERHEILAECARRVGAPSGPLPRRHPTAA